MVGVFKKLWAWWQRRQAEKRARLKRIRFYCSTRQKWFKGISTTEKMQRMKADLKGQSHIHKKLRRMRYDRFLKTPYWKAISEMVRQNAGYRCKRCGSNRNLQAHHTTYKRRGSELYSWRRDLVCLCRKCHEREHRGWFFGWW